MDPLTALRHAVLGSKEIRIDGANVILDGISYTGSTMTAAKSSKKVYYDILSVTFAYLAGSDAGFAFKDYLKAVREKGIKDFMLVHEIRELVPYLRGASQADTLIDRSRLSEGGEGGQALSASSSSSSTTIATTSKDTANVGIGSTASGSGAAVGIGGAGGLLLLDMTVRKEIPYRTRASVLECASKNLKEEVFKHFALAWGSQQQQAAAAVAVAAPAAGSKRPSSSSSSSASAAAAAAAKKSKPVATVATFANGGAMPAIRGTPIIIVPASASSLLNMYNAQKFLEQGQWVPPDQAKAALGAADKPTKITIKRTDSHGNACQYYVTDTVTLLQPHDWLKVVAVFAAGPDWQFKGWKWGARSKTLPDGKVEPAEDCPPVKIFDRAMGFHLYFEGEAPHPNCQNWAVTPLTISNTKRYLDPGVQIKFWRALDDHIFVKKPYLLPKGASTTGSGAVGAGSG